jgi:putative hemolysin
MKKVILLIILVFIIGLFWWSQKRAEEPQVIIINSFDECAAQGYPVMESYPRKCRTPEGRTFIEDIGNELEKTDLIRVSKPRPNELVSSPLQIEGEARGYWFFEADFPVKIFNEDGEELGMGIATAQSEWMTEDFVPFKVTLFFENSTTDRGDLVLEKDNPSGLSENADELRIPVRFQTGISQLPNPAAVYCEEQGGTLEYRMIEVGQKGFCIFNDGSECGQRDFFREDCKKGERFCKDLCGDGVCQEIVCMAVGCPCSESPETCPEDCI